MSKTTQINTDSVFIGGVEYTPKSPQQQKLLNLMEKNQFGK